MKIIIAPQYLITEIKKQRIQQSGQQVIHEDILTIDQYFEKYFNIEKMSPYQQYIEIYNELKKLDKKNIYYKLIDDSTFLSQVQTLINQLFPYQVVFNNIRDLDLKQVLLQLSNIVHSKSLYYDNIYNCEHIEIYDVSYSYFETKIIQKMLQNNAKLISFKTMPKIQAVEYKTMYDEINDIAKKILTQDVQQIKLHYTNDNYVPYIKNIFDTYKIPYYFLHPIYSCNIQIMWKDAIQLLQDDKKIEDLILKHNLFLIDDETQKKIKIYFETFKTFEYLDHLQNIDFEQCLSKQVIDDKFPELIFTVSQLQSLQEIEKSIAEVVLNMVKTLKKLKNQSVKLYFQSMYAYISQHVFDDIQLKTQEKIRKILMDCKNHLHLEHIQICLMKWIMDIKVVKNEYHGVMISKIDQPILFREICYQVGCSEKDYVNFQVLDGIFNESMNSLWKEIQNYPTVQQRYQHYIDQIKKTYDEKIICYSCAKLTDTTNTFTNEINVKLRAHQTIENNSIYQRDFVLSKEVAKQLFEKNGKIYLSVSKVQMYNQAPFEYFLNYGLKISIPLEKGYNPIVKGNLFHHILEKYAQQPDKMQQYLIENFKFLRKILLKAYEDEYAIDEYYIQLQLKYAEDNLKLIENKIIVKEQSYEYEHENVVIVGKIDRIDENNQNQLEIIDYKSSNKEFSKKQFEQGIDLQLPTYALIVNKYLYPKNTVNKAFYFPLITKNIEKFNAIHFVDVPKSRIKIQSIDAMNQKTLQHFKMVAEKLLLGSIENIVDENYKFGLQSNIFGIPKKKGDNND